jgi:N-acetylmuramoyl-L-alanine amidase
MRPALRPRRRSGPAIAVAIALGAVLPALFALSAFAARGVAPITVDYPAPRPSEDVKPRVLKGASYVSTDDLARIFSATKYWRPEIQKLSLRLGEHTVRFTVGAPVVLVDDDAANLVVPVRLVQGVVYAPEAIVGILFDRRIIDGATWDDASRIIRFRSPVHTIRQAQLYQRGRITEISATLLRGTPPRVLYATPSDILILFEGGTLDTAKVFSGGVVEDGSLRGVPGGVELRLHLAAGATGYTVSAASGRLRVGVTDDPNLVVAGIFTPLEPIPIGSPDRNVRTIVIDPGHGGSDPGETLPGGVAEKDAALDIARALRAALSQRLSVHVILTRDSDTEVSMERRAAIANDANADLFVSIHLDTEGALRDGGFRVYTLSPLGPGDSGEGGRPAVPEDIMGAPLLPWDSAQAGAVGNSMAVAQSVVDALTRAFPQSPVRVYAGPVLVVAPVVCPAILLENAPVARTATPEAMAARSYTIYDYTQVVAGAIEQLVRGARG